MSAPRVVAVIATHRRAFEVGRLIASLEKSAIPLHGLVVCDNASDPETQAIVERTTIPHRLLQPGENLGCGGGLRLAEQEALHAYPDLTHRWGLDDDVVVAPGTLGGLLAAMEACQVGSAAPMPHDVEGRLGWFPGLIRRKQFDVLRRAATPAEYLERCGPEPERFTWATGVALLVSREALEKGGLHRDDFWMRGEDLDFSLRMTEAAGGVFVPTELVAHLPPGGGKVTYNFAERMKHAAMLQNCAYISTRTSHGRTILKNWPGNAYRHLKHFGLGVWWDIVHAAWLGAVRGLPAGVPGGEYFRKRLAVGK